MRNAPTWHLIPFVGIALSLCMGLAPAAMAQSEPLESHHEVIVVGAGASGLSAAFFLRDRNLLVLEKNDRVGGRTRTGFYQGIPYAKGTEYLGEPEGAWKQIIDTLNVTPVQIPYPFGAAFDGEDFYWGEDGLALLTIENSDLDEFNRFVRTILELAEQYEEVPDLHLASDIAQLDDITARQWFEQEGFSAIYLDRYNGAARGLFGASLDEVSALSMLPEIAFDFVGTEPIQDVEDLENEPDVGQYDTDSYTFLTGITELTETIGHALNGHIRLNLDFPFGLSILLQKVRSERCPGPGGLIAIYEHCTLSLPRNQPALTLISRP